MADPIQIVKQKETLIRQLIRLIDAEPGACREARSYLRHLGYEQGEARWEFVRDSAAPDKGWTP